MRQCPKCGTPSNDTECFCGNPTVPIMTLPPPILLPYTIRSEPRNPMNPFVYEHKGGP